MQGIKTKFGENKLSNYAAPETLISVLGEGIFKDEQLSYPLPFRPRKVLGYYIFLRQLVSFKYKDFQGQPLIGKTYSLKGYLFFKTEEERDEVFNILQVYRFNGLPDNEKFRFK